MLTVYLRSYNLLLSLKKLYEPILLTLLNNWYLVPLEVCKGKCLWQIYFKSNRYYKRESILQRVSSNKAK